MENIGRNLENLKENLERLNVENIADSDEKDIASKWIILSVALFYRDEWVESDKLKLKAFDEDTEEELRNQLNCKSTPKMMKTANYLAEESEVEYLESRGGKGRATKEFRITDSGILLQRMISVSVMIRSHIFQYQGLKQKDVGYRLLNINNAWENLQEVSDREKDLLEKFLNIMNARPDELLFIPEEDQSEEAAQKFRDMELNRGRAELLEQVVIENEGEVGEKEREQLLKITGKEPEIGNRFLLYSKQNNLSSVMTEYSPTIEVEDEEEYLLHWLLFRRIKQSDESNKKLLKGLHHSLPDGEMDETLEEMIEEFSSEDRGRNQK
jgi:hypothetical protein